MVCRKKEGGTGHLSGARVLDRESKATSRVLRAVFRVTIVRVAQHDIAALAARGVLKAAGWGIFDFRVKGLHSGGGLGLSYGAGDGLEEAFLLAAGRLR